MDLYDRVADRLFTIDDVSLALRERETSSDFTRTTTVITLSGEDVHGLGEDVTYESELHYEFRDATLPDLTGTYTVEEFSATLEEVDLFPGDSTPEGRYRTYRRWGFESAALDLGLKQAGETLASALEKSYEPVRFVVSTRLGDPPSFERISRLQEVDPNVEFKLDPTSDWTADLVSDLVATEAVLILDLKGHYEGTEVDQSPDPALYELIVSEFPYALIEDPALTEATRPLFDGNEKRVTWDSPIGGVEDIQSLPWEPCWLNIKPSRFGSIQRLFSTIEYCFEHEIHLYGGGQFELDVGREHIQLLASLFYPDAPNDVAPMGYNQPKLPDSLPRSPLAPPTESTGLRWQSPDL